MYDNFYYFQIRFIGKDCLEKKLDGGQLSFNLTILCNYVYINTSFIHILDAGHNLFIVYKLIWYKVYLQSVV